MSHVQIFLALSAVSLATIFGTGCQKRPEVESAKTYDYSPQKPDSKKKPDAPSERSSMEGKWIVRVTNLNRNQGFQVFDIILLSITKHQDEYRVSLLGVSESLKVVEVAGSEITDTTAKVRLKRDTFVDIDFEVKLDKTVARGNGFFRGRLLPVELVATSANAVPLGRPKPAPLSKEFGAAMVDLGKGSMKSMRDLMNKNEKSPISYYVRAQWLDPRVESRAKKAKRPAPKAFAEYGKELEKLTPVWGARATAYWRFKMAENLIQMSRFAPEVALTLARDAKKAGIGEFIGERRVENVITLGIVESNCATAISTKDDTKRQKAIKVIERYVDERFRLMGVTTYMLAQAYLKAGEDAKAMQLFARLLVTPTMESELSNELKARDEKIPDVKQEFEQLWAKLKRKPGDMKPYLDRTYREFERAMMGHVVAIKPEHKPRRRVVCEVYTNSDLAHAAEADLALAAIQRSYPESEIIPLRYHLSATQGTKVKPDPLTCNDAKGRAFGRGGITAILVNGRQVPNPHRGNYSLWTGRTHRQLVEGMIASEQQQPAKYQIKLTGRIDKQTLQFEAAITGPKSPDLRVVFVLAEDHIDYLGENRIRRHEMVVRAIPAGVDGEPFDNAKMPIRKSFDLEKLRDQLSDYLKSYEELHKVKLPFKPVDFRNLHLIAMIEDSTNRKILQAASIRLGDPFPEKPVSKKPGKDGKPAPKQQQPPGKNQAS